MPVYHYYVTLHTELGERCGTMSLQLNQQSATGFLSLLGGTEPFSGIVDESGNCSINGKLITAVRTIPYTATGYVDCHQVRLVLQGGRHHFELTGEEKEDEEIL